MFDSNRNKYTICELFVGKNHMGKLPSLEKIFKQNLDYLQFLAILEFLDPYHGTFFYGNIFSR